MDKTPLEEELRKEAEFDSRQILLLEAASRIGSDSCRIAELEAQLARAESLISPMAGDTERLLEMGELCKQLAEQTRLAEERKREVGRLRELIPIECCAGRDPNCYGPKGCLVHALPADEQQNRIAQLEATVERLGKDAQRMLEVLQWYADQQNGKHARAAIEAHKSNKEK